jgi:hypothetical protein
MGKTPEQQAHSTMNFIINSVAKKRAYGEDSDISSEN